MYFFKSLGHEEKKSKIDVMITIKKDIPIVEEFLGTTNVTPMVSPLKCCRVYYKDFGCFENGLGLLLILTPMLKEDGRYLRDFLETIKKTKGVTLIPTEHKRDKNYVYTFSKG